MFNKDMKMAYLANYCLHGHVEYIHPVQSHVCVELLHMSHP